MPSSTAFYAPAHRVRPRVPPGSLGSVIAPSMDAGGSGLQDPRLQYNLANSATGAAVIGWLGGNRLKLTSQVPSAITTANIAALANVVSGVAMTKVSTTGAGITVVATGGFVPFPNYTAPIAAGVCAIDGLPAYVRVGTGDVTAFYAPTAGISRAISITGVSGGAGGVFLVSGFDWYGYAMSQAITVASGVNTVASTKCFKFISSVVPQFTDAHNYSVGTADVFGLNLAADVFADVEIYWVGVLQLLATFTAAVTSTATATTGDVRGSFTAGSASDAAKRLDIFVTPSLARITQNPQSTGLFGVAQF